jgi:hypothetical protein
MKMKNDFVTIFFNERTKWLMQIYKLKFSY